MHFSKMHFLKMHFSKIHFSRILQIFGGLVLGCIKTKFCKKICVRQHFSRSTRFASFCTAAISKFSQKIGLKNQQFSWNFSKILHVLQNLQNFAIIQKLQLDNLVDFETCCKTRIFLQKSVPIQPKTSNILPKFCQKLATTVRVYRSTDTTVSPWRSASAACGSPRRCRRPCPRSLRNLASRAELHRALSRLSRRHTLQVSTRLKSLAEIYTKQSFAQLCNLNFVSKSARKFAKILKKSWKQNQQSYQNMSQFLAKF